MRGSIRTRYKGSWNIILDLGYQPDPHTGHLKRKQKWFTVRGTKRDAEKTLAELLHATHRHELVEPPSSPLASGETPGWRQRSSRRTNGSAPMRRTRA